MSSFDDFIFNDEPINIENLLKEEDLPIRFVNILRNERFYSVDSYFKRVQELYLQYTSSFLFPNRLMAFYPQLKENNATRELTCNLSGAKIKKGSVYYTYYPFIEDIKNGRVYTVSKRINATLDYVDYFPKSLIEYEEWYYKIKNSYFNCDDSGPIDYYFLSVECGEDCLEPKLLGISKSRRKKG